MKGYHIKFMDNALYTIGSLSWQDGHGRDFVKLMISDENRRLKSLNQILGFPRSKSPLLNFYDENDASIFFLARRCERQSELALLSNGCL